MKKVVNRIPSYNGCVMDTRWHKLKKNIYIFHLDFSARDLIYQLNSYIQFNDEIKTAVQGSG